MVDLLIGSSRYLQFFRLSQKMQRQLERRQHGGLTSIRSTATAGGGKTVINNGFMSSISFTPVQGIEIINTTTMPPPDAAAGGGKTSTYFSSTSHFVKVKTPMRKWIKIIIVIGSLISLCCLYLKLCVLRQ